MADVNQTLDFDQVDKHDFRATTSVDVAYGGVVFRCMSTGESGVHTGRPRIKVRCLTCVHLGTKHGGLWPHASLLHEGTTGPREAMQRHFIDVRHPNIEGKIEVRDGLGNPLSIAGLYYVQDTRQIVGNCVLFWRKNGAGYTCELDEAGIYRGAEVSTRESDVAWPVNYVTDRVIRHVRVEALRRK